MNTLVFTIQNACERAGQGRWRRQVATLVDLTKTPRTENLYNIKRGKGGGPRSGARGRGLRRGAEVAFLEVYDAVGLFVAVWEGSGDCGGHCLASMPVSILIGGGGARDNENVRFKHSARGRKTSWFRSSLQE